MHKKYILFLFVFILFAILPVSGVMAQDGEEVWSIDDPDSVSQAISLYSIEGTYNVSACEYQGMIEQNCLSFTGTIQMVNPFELWLDGYRRCSGEIRPAYEEFERANRISIPPNYETKEECFVEVFTARPEAPVQQDELEQAEGIEDQWLLEEALSFFEFEGDAHPARILQHGTQSWEIPSADEEKPWVVTNVCENWVDGYRAEASEEVRPNFEDHPEKHQVSVPPNTYQVSVLMATLRPCEKTAVGEISTRGNFANIRSGPSEEFGVVGQLQSTPLSVDGWVYEPGSDDESRTWWRVGEDQWVASWVVNFTQADIDEEQVVDNGITSGTDSSGQQPVVGSSWSEQFARDQFSLSEDAALASCPGEASCYSVSAADGSFQITNNSDCWQDGYTDAAHELRDGQNDSKVGIPPGYSGGAGVATLRPCG